MTAADAERSDFEIFLGTRDMHPGRSSTLRKLQRAFAIRDFGKKRPDRKAEKRAERARVALDRATKELGMTRHQPTRPHIIAVVLEAKTARKWLGRLDLTTPYLCRLDHSRYPAETLREIRKTHR